VTDFRVHPALTSPAGAAVFFGIVASGLFDAGVADGLRAAGESQITVDTWENLNQARYMVELLSAVLAGFSWWLFRFRREQIKVPLAGIALGLFGSAFGIALIWSMLTTFALPEFEVAIDLTWRFAYYWSAFVALIVIGCVRFSVWSYRIMRGVA
jgi:hypothetical protein